MIHETAIVDPSAEIDEDVEIGPFCIVGAGVQIGKGTVVNSHAVIKGPTTIGCNNQIFQFASIGDEPQDLKYKGEDTRLEIGDNNRIREYVTIHRGTVDDNSITRIGSNNLFMVSCHIAHDCVIGNNTIIANATALAGHVHVGDHAILGGYTTVHQFTHIGEHSFSGFASAIDRDVLPYFTVAGNRARAYGINKEGLKRRGFSKESIRAIQEAFKLLVKSRDSHKVSVDKVRELAKSHPEVEVILTFIDRCERGWIR